ncbi:hypothetical protein BIU99_03355 [Plantibacter sp. MMLR14_011]|nr:hypothetical protein BIU99_03355 [Plantibacter sp. MMLR14_011]
MPFDKLRDREEERRIREVLRMPFDRLRDRRRSPKEPEVVIGVGRETTGAGRSLVCRSRGRSAGRTEHGMRDGLG